MKFCLSGWDSQVDGGIWWHEGHKDGSKNTCINAPAAVGGFRLAHFLPPAQAANAVKMGQALVQWTVDHLQTKDGLFADAIKVEDRHVNEMKWTYNAALMIRAELGYYRATGEPERLEAARRIAKAAATFMDPKTNAYRDGFKFSHLLVEADLEMYRATGDDSLLRRAIDNADYAYNTWKTNAPKDLIENASIARMLWLVADMQSEKTLRFWQKVERNRPPTPEAPKP
ncbi:MAG: glycoside hydrolase family 76 [Phycisphaerales bacterium]|nr:glycoside hydrolase family 76 [Phycisphaerales bacterium]